MKVHLLHRRPGLRPDAHARAAAPAAHAARAGTRAGLGSSETSVRGDGAGEDKWLSGVAEKVVLSLFDATSAAVRVPARRS